MLRGVMTAALVAYLASGAAACGGGKQQSLSLGYVRQANAVCADWTKALKDLGDGPALSDANRMVVFTKQQLAIDEDFTAKFKAVPAQPSEQPVLGPVYQSFDAINGAEAGTLSAAAKDDRAGIQSFHQVAVDETTKVNDVLKRLNLSICAS